MKYTGWGRYPDVFASSVAPYTVGEMQQQIGREKSMIGRGLGRSYGDSALASHIVETGNLDHFLAFDPTTGILHCHAGVSLAEILKVFVPKGWFLPVTPGTKFVSIGGAIASDVHGKNHHVDGCFSNHLYELTLIDAQGSRVTCSRVENPELFYATCGGMGLTGVIVEARIRLIPVKNSFIDETVIKTRNISHALQVLEEKKQVKYTVAWIDCLASGESLGRSLIMLGEHSSEGETQKVSSGALAVPCDMPSFVLNKYSVKAFNFLYYNRVMSERVERRVHYEPFFYPLDGINNWNRLYGKNGFLQYQFVIPKSSGEAGLVEILEKIAASGRGSFLAVLKIFGQENDNYLSFPTEGYTLALDFKVEDGIFEFLESLDALVLKHGGRLYLAKDARMSSAMFQASYPRLEAFKQVRDTYDPEHTFSSMQSIRLGL